MKTTWIVLAASLAFMACSGDAPKEAPKTQATAVNPDVLKGKDLVEKNDCLTCHKVDMKLVGPSYQEVAKKYAGLPDTIVTHLANKVLKGGTGVWGQVPMAAHGGLSQEDATLMVKYVLAQH